MAGADSSHSFPVPIVHKNGESELYQFSAARIAGSYLVAGLLWIFLSDSSLAWSGEVTVTGLLISMGKGASFVIVSSCVVFWLSKREYHKTMNATALLGAVVEGTTDAVFVKDLQGRYLLINKAGAKFIGRSVSEVLKRDDRGLFEASEVQRLMDRDKEIMAGGQVVTREETLTSNGMTRTYQATKAPLFDSSGRVVGLIGVSRDVTDQTRIEAELRETDARLREAQRIARLGSWYWEQATDRVSWSDAEFELFGVDKRKVRPSLESFLESVHPEDRSTILSRVEALQQGANEIACDVRVIRPNGTCIWVHSRARASRDSSGKLVRVEGIDQDVTEQRLAEAKLREQEMLALEAAELAHVGGWGFDPITNQSDWTREVFNIFGVNASSPPPIAKILDLFLPEYRPIIETAFAKAVQDGTPYDLELQLTAATGERKWVRSICRPIVEGGKVIRVRGSIQDITDRKQVEAELRIREERYRQLFESNPHPMWVYDIDTFQFLAVNDAAVQTYGYTRDEFLSMNLSDIQSAEDLARLKSYVTQMASGLNRSGIWRHRRKNGELFDVDVHSHGLPHGYGRSRLVLALDITDRKQLEEQFRQSQKMEAVGRLAGGIAHDFNNLLTVINGYSDLLLKQKNNSDPAFEMLSEIRDAGERAARLTHQLLAFSRKSIVQPKLIDLNELVTESTKFLRRLIGEDITLELLMEKSPLRVMIDPGQVEQVLMNLVVNSRDAMPSGGRLTIETSIEEKADDNEKGVCQFAALRVTDTGIGIDENDRDKIFEPFFTTKDVGQGTGLGLSVVLGIVQQAGGSISVESETGSGSTFRILLPHLKQQEISNKSRSSEIIPRGDETILLVEDEDAVRTLVQVALEKQGFKVLSASCGMEAINLLEFESNSVDLLVTDVIMPGISGLELADEIRKTHPHLKAIFISGYTDDALYRHGMKGSSDQFIQKPFTPLALIQVVRELLDESEK